MSEQRNKQNPAVYGGSIIQRSTIFRISRTAYGSGVLIMADEIVKGVKATYKEYMPIPSLMKCDNCGKTARTPTTRPITCPNCGFHPDSFAVEGGSMGYLILVKP